MSYKITDTIIVDNNKNIASIGTALFAGPVIIGGGTSTGTVSQPLQVTGSNGAYIGGNLGIGSTNPSSKLWVSGDIYNAGIHTAQVLSASKDPGTGIATDFTNSLFGNGWRVTAPGSTTYYKLATLPPGDGGNTFDHLIINGVLGAWTNGNQTPFEITFSNRGAFNYKYVSYGSVRSDVRIIGISTNSTVEIWAQHQASQFTKLVYTIANSIQAIVVSNPTSTTTAPTGTTVFDSSTVTPRFIINESDNVGVGTATPGSKLTVVGDGRFTGVVTATTFIGALTGTATSLSGGAAGNIVYQSGPNTTAFLTNGGSGTVLQSNGVGNAPTWVAAAPSGAVSGITVRDSNNNLVGTSGSVTQLTFSSGLSVTGTTGAAGIATIILSSNIVGTSLSISGISTFTNGPVLIGTTTLTGTASQPLQVNGGAYVSGDNTGVSLGIGITNPTYPVDIRSSISSTAAMLRLYPTTTTRAAQILYVNSGSSNMVTGVLNSAGNGQGISGLTAYAGVVGMNAGTSPLLLVTNALERVRVFDTGEVGIGTTVLTGTSSQVLQVNGGAYVSGNLGIGTTNPTSKLHVVGDVLVSGITTSGGVNVTTGNDYKINGTSVLTSTTLGSAVVNSSLTSVGTLGLLSVTGVTTSGGVNVTTGTDYKINGTSVLTSTTLGSAVVNSSLTSVGTLGILNVTGVTTASRFVSGIATGTAPLTVTSTTKVTNLNADLLDDNDSTYYTNASNLSSGIVPSARITASSGDFTVGQNLNVTGNITIGGTTAILNATTLQIKDKDIVLGITTNASNQDVSTDTTANHGGIAIASTEGSPLIDINGGVGTDSIPSTYKQIMWLKSGSWTGLGTDAWLFNYGVGIGSTQVPNGVRLAVGAVQFTQNDLSVVRNITASGVITATSGFSGNASSATYATNAGIATNVIGGIGSITQLQVTGISTFNNGPVLIGTGTSTGTASQRLQVTGGAYVSGSVGIGTNNPTVALQLSPNASISNVGTGITLAGTVGSALTVAQFVYANTNTSYLRIKATRNTAGSDWTTASTKLLQVIDVTEMGYVEFNPNGSTQGMAFGSGATELVRLTSAGNFGVGRTNPTSKLEVLGTIAAYSADTTSVGSFVISNAGLLDITSFKSTGGTLRFVTANTSGTNLDRGRVDSSGNFIIGTTSATGTASQPLQVTGGAYVSGSVGIGTASPAFTADIAGDARVTSTNKMRFGGTAGTTNFYIQYNSTANSLDFVAG